MAVRHQVENLIRRGNIFYWRARVPKSFAFERNNGRLSLSLHVCDHRIAGLVARNLNMRLAELKNTPSANVMTQDAFHQFFVAERDKQLDKLGNIAVASRRYGKGDFTSDVDIDLQHGWAYRLHEHFGQGAEFDFSPVCRARQWLLSQDVPDDHIDQIAEDYRVVKALSQRGILELHLRKAMDHHGIANNALNREKAMIAYFRANADALMAVQDRYPLANHHLSSRVPSSSMPAAFPFPASDLNQQDATESHGTSVDQHLSPSDESTAATTANEPSPPLIVSDPKPDGKQGRMNSPAFRRHPRVTFSAASRTRRATASRF